ncbi:MAG: N-acetylmuramoyl-L-alanine amidase [candidate division KSB1 bacterium]|nr:N-acetylmuramoyl-L-alanine amidase [candidate division KSB1 bacterium]
MEIQWIESKFFDRNKIANAMIIIHHTGSKNGVINSLQGTIDWFKPDPWRSSPKVSAHYIIPRKEQAIIQMVRDEHVAYHAGESQWRINGVLRQNLNDWSIGIELQGDGNLFEYTDFQYEALIWLCRQKMQKFGITEDLIVGHEDVSPGRKNDPGVYFDWRRVRRALYSPPPVVVPGRPGGEEIPERDDVEMPSEENRPLLERLFDLFLSIFKRK